MRKASFLVKGVVLLAASAMAVAGCSNGTNSGQGASGSDGSGPAKGGTLTFLTLRDQIQHLDPQRNYTGEDLAFTSAYLNRTLNVFKLSPDGKTANSLRPDLATDTGTPNADATSWSWTLKDGLTWEDGSPLTCEDIKYGVSRTFATDIITDGPSYAIQYLDIPTNKDGSSVYKGPYVTKDNDTAAFDKAVVCDGNTITFNLKRPVGDFNYTVTMTAFAPVPKAADTGEKYDDHPVSNGPYKVQEYSKGNQLVLVRNDNWSPKTDDYRPAYPDKIVMKFGLDASVIDQRMIQDSGEDQQTLSTDSVEPASLATVFGSDQYADRRVNEFDPFVQYLAVNVKSVPDLNHRKAIAAALDRQQQITISGGKFAGQIADGVIKPNLPADYAPSGMWDGLLGKGIPDQGDPAFAKQLIAESGKPMPTLQYDYPQTPTNDRAAAAIVSSLGRAGIKVRPNPIESGQYYGIALDPAKAGDLLWAGWGPDWPNGSTVVPPLFTPNGGFDMSQVSDRAFNKKVLDAEGLTDLNAQATQWKALNKEAMSNVWAIPTYFRREQRLAGSKVKAASGKDGQIYLWSPYGSWSYPDLYVEE
jgi:peptide/nickel transport system substrate-binding protein